MQITGKEITLRDGSSDGYESIETYCDDCEEPCKPSDIYNADLCNRCENIRIENDILKGIIKE